MDVSRAQRVLSVVHHYDWTKTKPPRLILEHGEGEYLQLDVVQVGRRWDVRIVRGDCHTLGMTSGNTRGRVRDSATFRIPYKHPNHVPEGHGLGLVVNQDTLADSEPEARERWLQIVADPDLWLEDRF